MKFIMILWTLFLAGCAQIEITEFAYFHPNGHKWEGAQERYHYLGLKFDTLEGVNDYVNTFRYVTDEAMYHVEDYWASPNEFFKNKGGDCEDFAIAKYFLIKENHLGNPQLLEVYDIHLNNLFHMNQNKIAHIVVKVGDEILDQQIKHIYKIDSDEFLLRYEVIGIVK